MQDNPDNVINAMCELAEEVERNTLTNCSNCNDISGLYSTQQVEVLLEKQRELSLDNAKIHMSRKNENNEDVVQIVDNYKQHVSDYLWYFSIDDDSILNEKLKIE
jgi:hypothetical protein